MGGRITIGTIDIDGEIFLCSMQKGCQGGITIKDLENAIELSIEKGDEIRRLIKEKCKL